MDKLLDSVPLYIRITEGAKDYLLMGTFKEEERLPSTTYLSKQYGINIATVNKALAILVDEGYVYKKRGIGMFVKKGATNRLIKERRKYFEERYLFPTLKEAFKLRYTKEELMQIGHQVYQEVYGKPVQIDTSDHNEE